MSDRISQLEARLSAVEQRLVALEDGTSKPREQPESEPDIGLSGGLVANAATHLGRVLLIFGGAYLLRAITDGQIVPTGVGILLGGSYALVWLFMAYRHGQHEQQRASALFFAGSSIVLALPLLIEAVTRFELLTGAQAAIALVLYCTLYLLVGVLRDLRSLGWLVTAGSGVTAMVLLNAAHVAVPVAILLMIMGIGSLWACYLKGWTGPQWLGGLGAGLGCAVVNLLSTSDRWAIETWLPFVLVITLLCAYLVSFVIRSHLMRQSLGLFEALQTVFLAGVTSWAAGVGFEAGDLNPGLVGALSLVFGAVGYGLSLTPETRSVRGRNFYFYSSIGLGFVVAGSAMILSSGQAAAGWSLMAIVMAGLSGRFGRVAFSLQCTVLLIAASVFSGLLGTGIQALAGSNLESWPEIQLWHLIVATATVACLFIPVAQHSERWGVLSGLPQLAVLALSVWAVGGIIVALLAPVVAGVGGSQANLGALASLRTALLCAASVTLAASSLHWRWPEARWLAYPVLIIVGFKLLLEDFPNGQPASLFVALAVVGSALIVVAKIMSYRSRRQPSSIE